MGIGFAIPASLARQVMEQIIAEGGVTRGWIGVQIQDLTPELAESFRLGSTRGALVTQVMKGEPAERAGVKPGDVLVAVESKPVANASALLNLVAALKPGQKAQLTLLRNQKELQVTVQVGKRPRPGAS
jgi:serine protease DegQ